MFKVPEKFRVKTGKLRSTAADGNNGAFQLTSAKLSLPLFLRCRAHRQDEKNLAGMPLRH